MPTRATLRIIPTPERRLLLRESLAAAVAAAAAAAERRGHGGASPAPAGDASSAPGQDAASAGVGGAAGPAGGGIFVDSVQARPSDCSVSGPSSVCLDGSASFAEAFTLTVHQAC